MNNTLTLHAHQHTSNILTAMGCRASKEDVAEPRSKQSHGRDKLHMKDKEAIIALKPNEITCALDGSECICSLYNNIISHAELNNTSSPPSVFMRTPDESLSSDDDDDEDEDFDPSIEIPKKLSIAEEDNNNASQSTALATLSGEKAVSDNEELEERVEAILAANDGGELILPDQSEQCCALGVLSQSAILQALMSTGPVITQQFFRGHSSSARVGHMAVISGPEPIRWETPLRKAEIIDLDEEQNVGESLMLENTPEHLENQSRQEPTDDCALTEEQPQQYSKLQQPEDANTHKTVLGLAEPRKGKLPPLSIVPPIFVELPTDPFTKPEFPIIVKQALTMEVKVPGMSAQFEDMLSSDRTPPLQLALELVPDSPNESNHEDKRSKSSLVTEHCEDGTPTPVTRSSIDSGWQSPPRDLPDLDIENIMLLSESPEELDNCVTQLPLISMLECHGIHMDKKNLISPSLRLIS